MRRTIGFVVLLWLSASSLAEAGRGGGRGHRGAAPTGTGSSSHSHAVRGYTKKSGTYVAPHRQSNPDHTQRNNYTTKGNVNPHTGAAGTRNATH